MYNHKKPFLSYNRRLTASSQQMRRNPTHAEALIWKYVLRKRQLNGLLFYRQRPIGRFIVDFYCPTILLAIEVDGGYHETRDLADIQRSQIIKQVYGVTIVRIPNEWVKNRLDEVRIKLTRFTSSKIKPLSLPTGRQADKERGWGKTCRGWIVN